ncbi:MAG: response regulator [Lachnospiraceae bacterium]|nr:response regulator [Lachnospiraceae bacterium]
MDKKEQLIAQGDFADFDSFLIENRKMINEQFNKVLIFCIFAGPFIAVAVALNAFKGVTYYTALFISVFMAALTLVHRYLMKKFPDAVFTSILALFAIDVLLVVMDSAHLTIYITWFLIPLLALQFCDFNLYSVAVVINYGFMVFATWNMAPYFAERRIDVDTAYAYFASRFGGLTIETIVMIVAGYSLSKIMTTHYKTLIEQYKNLKKEKDVSERAIAASEAKSAFLSNMSHEIRTPMNTVLGMNEMILRECDDADILTYSEGIRVAGGTLLGIINDILDFSKIEAGKMEIMPVEYDLSSVINDLVNMIQKRADEKGLQLVLDLDSNTPKMLKGDDVRIKQVITNILSNAVKYTEKGSITFSIGYEKIEDEPDAVLLNVSVKDTGIGIKKEDLPKLFEAYQRIEEGRNRHIEGTGLGMNITNMLLSMMGSKLQVESEYGKGSRFYFDIIQEIKDDTPVGDFEEHMNSAAEIYSHEEAFTAPDAKVLVVDDNAMNRKVFKSLLKYTGMQIDEAGGGQEALDLAQKAEYDVVFLDHMMPDMDGVETLHRMRELEGYKEAPIYVLTANAVTGAREQYLKEGFTGFISKPIVSEKLEHALVTSLPKDLLKPYEGEREERAQRPDTDELPSVEGLDWDYAFLHLPDKEALMQAAEEFSNAAHIQADKLDKMYDDIRSAADDNQKKAALDSYRILVHGMKSGAATIGIVPLAGMAKVLEYAARDEDQSIIERLHEIFIKEWRTTDQRLKSASGNEGGTDEKPEADMQMLSAMAQILKNAMEEFDVDAADDIMKKIRSYSYPQEINDKIDALSAAVGDLDEDEVNNVLARMGV